MTIEEQFRQAVNQLDLPKAQLEAICDLHSAIYEGVDWKGIYDKLSHLDDYPKVSNAIKLGAAALIGASPIHGIYVTDWDAMAKRFGGGDKSIEQVMDEKQDINEKKYPNLPERTEMDDEAYAYNDTSVPVDDNSLAEKERVDTIALNQGGAGRENLRDRFDVQFPDKSDATSTDAALRKFVETNLSWNFKSSHDKQQQDAHIDRVLSAVKKTAAITSSRGIGEAELLALICVESMFDDKPNTTSYKGIAQLGKDAIIDAKEHAGEVGLGTAPMRNPEIVEDAINMAASYLLYIMYKTERSNKVNMVNGEEDDDKEVGDMRFVFACYNAGIGEVANPFDNGKKVSIPQLYRKVLRKEMTPDQAIEVKGSMKEALTYPSKILTVLDYLKSIGIQTNFDSTNVNYSKITR